MATKMIDKASTEKKSEDREYSLRFARIVHTLSFVFVLFIMGVLSLTLKKPEVSEVEKRELAKMPSFSVDELVEGNYTKDVELHYADTFPFRDQFVTLANKIDEMRGIRLDGVRVYQAAPQAGADTGAPPITEVSQQEIPSLGEETAASDIEEQSEQAEVQQSQQEQERKPYQVEDDGAVGEQAGGIFIYKNRAMEIFGTGFANGTWYGETLAEYQKRWGDSVQVYNMVVPSSMEFTLPDRYKSIGKPQLPIIENIYDNLGDKAIGVDAYGALADHADEYLYFYSDHHWTGLAAYYAYTAFAQSAGFEPLALTDFDKYTIEGFSGTLKAQTGDTKIKEDHVDYYVAPVEYTAVRTDRDAPHTEVEHRIWAEYASGSNAYSVFLGGDYPLIKVHTANKNGKSILMVKESYGNAFAPYLLSHYEHVYIVDQRYFTDNLVDYVKENEIDEVLFLNNIFAANTKVRITETERLMNQ